MAGRYYGSSDKAKRSKHGMIGTPTYRTWNSMMTRCLNPRHSSYPHYGGRGITVCDRWLSFANFVADMGERPIGKTLDRYPDNDGNYEPTNCRWAALQQQANNTRANKLISFGGRTMTLREWATHLGIKYFTLASRLNRGWPCELALVAPRKAMQP